MKLIDEDAAIKAVRKALSEYNGDYDCRSRYGVIADATENLKELPPAQSERKMGKWIPSDSELEIKCNKCGKDFSEYVYSIDYIFLAEYPKFCPNCGAVMKDGEQE